MIQGILPNGVSLLDVKLWIDGIGPANRKNGTAVTYTDIVPTTGLYAGKIIPFNGSSSKIECGAVGNIRTAMFWCNPTTVAEYPIDLDGSINVTITDNKVVATGWTSPEVYVNRTKTTTVKNGVWQLITVTSDTAIDASAVVLGSIGANFFEGSMTQVILMDKKLTATQIGQFHNKFEVGTPWNYVGEEFGDYAENMTFLKRFDDLDTGTVTATQLDAELASGSATATFTATRSASAPATYVDDNGVIQLVTTSDVGRIRGGYYDTTGFHAQKGLMIEGASTNLTPRTDGTAGTTIWTGWSEAHTTANASTQSLVSIPELTSISGAKSQRLQYVDGADVGASISISSTASGVGTVVQNDTVTISAWLRSQTGVTGANVTLVISARDASNAALTAYSSSALTLSSSWKRFTYTVQVTDASASQVISRLSISSIDQGDIADVEIWGVQLEKSVLATSFIPTTTAALTRGAETLKYAISGNRTVSSESIFVKFSPMGTFANDGVNRYLLDSDNAASRRLVEKGTTGTILTFKPNAVSVCAPTTTTNPVNGVSYVFSAIAYGATGDPNGLVYMNGIVEDTSNNDWTATSFGTNFYVGSRYTGINQANCAFQRIAFFSDAKGATDVAAITNLLNS